MTLLSERLAALTHGDWEADIAVNRLLWPEREDYEFHSARWTSDLSAVVGEIERRGWWFALDNMIGKPDAMVYHGPTHEKYALGEGPTPCLALLRALVAAVETEK